MTIRLKLELASGQSLQGAPLELWRTASRLREGLWMRTVW